MRSPAEWPIRWRLTLVFSAAMALVLAAAGAVTVVQFRDAAHEADPDGALRGLTDDITADLEVVTRQLGRAPRGVLAIAYRCPNGEPGVVKTAPRLPDGTPFPTLYYLTHPVLTAAASRLETTGLMREMNRRLGQDAELAAAYRRAHESYLSERDALEPLGTTVSAGGMPDRVKCLHVLIAHSLAKGPGLNPFGDEALALLAAEPRTAATLVAGQWR